MLRLNIKAQSFASGKARFYKLPICKWCMSQTLARIAQTLGEKKFLQERFDLFRARFGGSQIELNGDYPAKEFRGNDGVAICLLDGQVDEEWPFQPYAIGTHGIQRDGCLRYVECAHNAISSLQPGDTYSELEMLSALMRTEKDGEEVLIGAIEAVAAANGFEIQGFPSRTSKQREINARDFTDRRLVVVRNDILAPKRQFVCTPGMARDTFFCAMYEDALPKYK